MKIIEKNNLLKKDKTQISNTLVNGHVIIINQSNILWTRIRYIVKTNDGIFVLYLALIINQSNIPSLAKLSNFSSFRMSLVNCRSHHTCMCWKNDMPITTIINYETNSYIKSLLGIVTKKKPLLGKRWCPFYTKSIIW